jgi:hypothetical protein
MQLFVLTNHCKAKVHCKTCRSPQGGLNWRRSLKKMFKLPDDNENFDCPWGVPWGDDAQKSAPVEQHKEPKAIVAAASPQAGTSEPAPVATTTQARSIQQQRASGSRQGGGCGCGRK